MYSCKEISNRSSDYLDKELTFSERMKFGVHLLLCGHCRKFISHMKKTTDIVKELPRNNKELSETEAEGLGARIVSLAESKEQKNNDGSEQ